VESKNREAYAWHLLIICSILLIPILWIIGKKAFQLIGILFKKIFYSNSWKRFACFLRDTFIEPFAWLGNRFRPMTDTEKEIRDAILRDFDERRVDMHGNVVSFRDAFLIWKLVAAKFRISRLS